MMADYIIGIVTRNYWRKRRFKMMKDPYDFAEDLINCLHKKKKMYMDDTENNEIRRSMLDYVINVIQLHLDILELEKGIK